MELNNNFVDLLSQAPFTFYDRLHIFLIEFKWEHHAKLLPKNIEAEGGAIPNVNFIRINADQFLANDQERLDAKVEQIRRELIGIFPSHRAVLTVLLPYIE